MPYRIGVALRHAVRDGAVACDEAVRNARLTMIAGARAATGVAMGGMGLKAVCAVVVSPARPGVEGMKAATTKAAGGMKATATVETATAPMETTATMETTTATVETAATTMETAAATAPATARLRCVRERQPHDCAREDPSEHQPNPFAAPSSQHIFLHPN
jgi:hypothetical protein